MIHAPSHSVARSWNDLDATLRTLLGLWLACGIALSFSGCSASRPVAEFEEPHPPDLEGARKGDSIAPPSSEAGNEASSSWTALLERALRQHPAIREARALDRAAEHELAAAGALPDPMVLVSLYASELETRVGPARHGLTLQQRIPFPTKLAGEIDVARARRAVEAVKVEIAVRDALTDLVDALHERAYLVEALSITARVMELLEGFEERAQAELERGRISLPEVHRAQAQRAQLENDRIVLRELQEAEETRLRALLVLPEHARLPAPLPIAPRTLHATHEEAQEMARRWNQELRMASLRIEVEARGVALARQGHWPDMQIGATWTEIDRLRVPNPPRDDGKDPFMLQLGFTLPFLWNPVSENVGRARARELAASHALEGSRQNLRTRIAKLYWKVSSTERRLDLLQSVLLPQAREAALLAEVLFDEGQESFLGLLETVAAWHEFRLAEARTRVDLAQAMNRLEQAIGVPFERSRTEEER